MRSYAKILLMMERGLNTMCSGVGHSGFKSSKRCPTSFNTLQDWELQYRGNFSDVCQSSHEREVFLGGLQIIVKLHAH